MLPRGKNYNYYLQHLVKVISCFLNVLSQSPHKPCEVRAVTIFHNFLRKRKVSNFPKVVNVAVDGAED